MRSTLVTALVAWQLLTANHDECQAFYAAAFERAIAALTEADRTMGRPVGAPAADPTVSPTRVA